jgi:CRISPR-associated protein (TIGR03984 family)
MIPEIKTDILVSGSPEAWLEEQALQYGLGILLAFTDSALVWGKLEDKKFILSSEAFPQKLAGSLNEKSLQQVRLFSQNGEVFLWRTEHGFTARRILDQPEVKTEEAHKDVIEERYWLWGNQVEQKMGFTLMVEGQQGFYHAPPFEGLGDKKRLALRVRHYIQYDKDSHQAYIALSRLINLEEVKEKGEGL